MAMPFDNVFSDKFNGWDAADHFQGGSIVLAGEGPVEMSFDSIFGDQYNGLYAQLPLAMSTRLIRSPPLGVPRLPMASVPLLPRAVDIK